MSENPYHAPAACAVPELRLVSPWAEPFGRCLRRWGLLCAVNAVLGLAVGLSLFERTADRVGILLALAAIVAATSTVDWWLRRVGWMFLADALRVGAILKALLQIIVVLDLLLGGMAIAAVRQLAGDAAFVTPALVTLAYGAGAAGTALTLGIGLGGLASLAGWSKRWSARRA